MLDKEVFKEKIKELKLAYRNWNFDITDKELVVFWYNKFNRYENNNFKNAVDEYIDNERNYPTIAGIKEHIYGKKIKKKDFNKKYQSTVDDEDIKEMMDNLG